MPQPSERVRIQQIHSELGIPTSYAARTRLPKQSIPTDLVAIGPDMYGRPQRLRRKAALAWKEMRDSAADDGIVLQVVSAFRSLEYQAELIRRKLDVGQSLEEILRVVAAPGYSEHHSGRALDLSTPNCDAVTESFEGTAAFDWLTRSASRFRFGLSYPRGNSHGVIYEPWHWCYIPSN